MATISKLPSGSWRVQVRRKGKYVSDTFLRRGDAERWGRSIESKIDRGEPLHLSSEAAKTFGDLVELHKADLADVGQKLGRSKAASLTFLSDRLGHLKPTELSREELIKFGRERSKEGAGPVTVGIAKRLKIPVRNSSSTVLPRFFAVAPLPEPICVRSG